jgi:hypothetical protein
MMVARLLVWVPGSIELLAADLVIQLGKIVVTL